MTGWELSVTYFDLLIHMKTVQRPQTDAFMAACEMIQKIRDEPAWTPVVW